MVSEGDSRAAAPSAHTEAQTGRQWGSRAGPVPRPRPASPDDQPQTEGQAGRGSERWPHPPRPLCSGPQPSSHTRCPRGHTGTKAAGGAAGPRGRSVAGGAAGVEAPELSESQGLGPECPRLDASWEDGPMGRDSRAPGVAAGWARLVTSSPEAPGPPSPKPRRPPLSENPGPPRWPLGDLDPTILGHPGSWWP